MNSIKPWEVSRFKSGRYNKKQMANFEEQWEAYRQQDEEDGVANSYKEVKEKLARKEVEEQLGLKAGTLSLSLEEQARYGIFGCGRLRVAGTGSITDPQKCGHWIKNLAPVCYQTEFHPNSTVFGEHFGAQVSYHKVKASCDSPLCPVCVPSWCGREAGASEVRFKALIEFYKKQGINYTAEHVIVSVHPDSAEASLWIAKPQYAFDRAKKAIMKRGIEGGLMILHAHRIRSYEQARRENKIAGRYQAPHIHCIALFRDNAFQKCRDCKAASSLDCLACGGFEGVTRRQYLKDKLIVKVAEERSEEDSDFTANAIADMEHKRSLAETRTRKKTRKTIGGTVAYQLSHCAIQVGEPRSDGKKSRNRAVVWFGCASYRKFHMDKPERFVRLCPICHCEMELSRYVGSKETAPKNDDGLDSLYDSGGLLRWIKVAKKNG